jgi:hypothetical protein
VQVGLLCLHRFARVRRLRWIVGLDACFVPALLSREIAVARRPVVRLHREMSQACVLPEHPAAIAARLRVQN